MNLRNCMASQIDIGTKFDITHTELAVKIRVTAYLKEKRTRGLKQVQNCVKKLQYFKNY